MNTTKTKTSLRTRTVGAVIFAVLIFGMGTANAVVEGLRTKIKGENGDDAEQILLQHQSVKLC